MARTRTEESDIPELRMYARCRRFTIAEYHLLKGSGVLTKADHVELLDGYVLYKLDYVTLPPASPHFPDWQQVRRWTQTEYDRMTELGIIRAEDGVEMIDGYLVLSPT
jgi:hypothetical protein